MLKDRTALWSRRLHVVLVVAPMFGIPSVVGTYGLKEIDSTTPHTTRCVEYELARARRPIRCLSEWGPYVEISEVEYRAAHQRIFRVLALANRMFAFLGFCLAWLAAF